MNRPLPRDRTHYKPTEISRARGIDVDVVRSWIATGQLPATDCSATPGGKPRWRIAAADLAAFDAARRSKAPPPLPRVRRRRDPTVRQWF